MGTVLRLDSISPSLTKAFRDARDDQRRRAALAACLIAVAQNGLRGSDVDAALTLLRDERNRRSDMRHKLEVLSEQLDERYFKLSEEAESISSEALDTFRKARAAAALAFALSPNSEQLHEAMYEAIAASTNQSETVRAAEMPLVRQVGD
jgi:hypothetical protein